MSIIDNNPSGKTFIRTFIDEGNSDFQFLRVYNFDEDGVVSSVSDINYDGTSYTPTGNVKEYIQVGPPGLQGPTGPEGPEGTPDTLFTPDDSQKIIKVQNDGTVEIFNVGGTAKIATKNANGSVGSETQSLDSEVLGEYEFCAFDGVEYRPVASIKSQMKQDATPTQLGSEIRFSTVPVFTQNPIDRMLLQENGDLSLLGGGINDLSEPGFPQSAATKNYVDSLIPVFGTEAEDFINTGNVTITSGSPIIARSFTTQSKPPGRYRISMLVQYEPAAAANNDLFTLRIDGNQIGLEYEYEGKDVQSDIRNIIALQGYYQHNTTGAFDIQLFASRESGTQVIHGVSAEVWRVS